jgi:hypothetical protein
MFGVEVSDADAPVDDGGRPADFDQLTVGADPILGVRERVHAHFFVQSTVKCAWAVGHRPPMVARTAVTEQDVNVKKWLQSRSNGN